MNVKDFIEALAGIENRKLPKEVVIDALKEALSKAYKKHIEIPDALVKVDINEKTGELNVYQQYTVVEEVDDDELEISLSDAQKIKADIQVGELYDVKKSIDDLGRAAAILAKNVLKQKIREAEKQSVYDEYIDKKDEMVIGIIESVEEKFVVVNLGKTLAMMPKAAQIPGENYKEGQKIRLVITEVTKETKGAQVLVSRADAKLVKRLFEKEVPEIYQGIVEIKAIAREAGERTKMAVHSKREDVDAIGACIGPRGSRVQVVIQELGNEKIDIFEWSENTVELIKNSLSPAQIIGVLQTREKKGLLVVVEDNQLSLAIGKKGKNARLAVRLTGQRIDIKSRTEMDKLDYDWKVAIQDYSFEVQAAILEKAAKKAEEERARQRAEAEAIALEKSLREPELVEEVIEPKAEPVAKVTEPVKVKKVKKPLERKTEYVSKFETLAEAAKPVAKVEPVLKRRPSKKEEEERKLRSADIRKDKDYEIKIEYTAEELAEIEKQNAQAEPIFEEDIDYDQYDEFYEDEE
ncbi:MAG: transcription termination/antitermination protein NusA [Erysipelotrichaceae bacterium]|nr:transcription termination/antitermination protein NusA [Erysipelotrichaceae bacterium]